MKQSWIPGHIIWSLSLPAQSQHCLQALQLGAPVQPLLREDMLNQIICSKIFNYCHSLICLTGSLSKQFLKCFCISAILIRCRWESLSEKSANQWPQKSLTSNRPPLVHDHAVIPLTLMMVVPHKMGPVSLFSPFFLALNLLLKLILQGKVCAPMPFISWSLLIYAGLSLPGRQC